MSLKFPLSLITFLITTKLHNIFHFFLAAKPKAPTSGCFTVNGTPCIFPWTYSADGDNYQGCANPDSDSGGPWCPTGVDDNGIYISGSGKWGYCNLDICPHCYGEDSCCQPYNQCSVGEGDCDEDEDCKGNLVCGEDNCDGKGFDSSDDCCIEPGKILNSNSQRFGAFWKSKK